MRIRELENNSNEDVELKHKNGTRTTLPPGTKLKNVDIVNLSEIGGRVKIKFDLTEVTGESSGKQRLNG